jgi:tetratricopeptide (TPR) repeat protein
MKTTILRSALLATALMLFASSVAGKNKLDKVVEQAEAAEARGDWDRALELYLQALDVKPNAPRYLIPMRKARFEAAQAVGRAVILSGPSGVVLELKSEGDLAHQLAKLSQPERGNHQRINARRWIRYR